MQKALLFTLLFFCIFGCKQQTAKVKSPPSREVSSIENTTKPTAQMEMTIEGMMCALGCAATIQKKLNATAGITSATVDFDSKRAQLGFDQALLTPDAIKAIVTDISKVYSIPEFSVSN